MGDAGPAYSDAAPSPSHSEALRAIEALLARSRSTGEMSSDVQTVLALCRTLLGVNEARRSLNALQDSEAAVVSLIEKLIKNDAPQHTDQVADWRSALPLMLGTSLGEAAPDPTVRSKSPPQPMTTQIRVRLLGRFEVEINGVLLPAWRSRRARQLLQYLLLNHREEISRHRLMGLFWPDHSEERAENNLSLTVMTLRRVLEQAATGAGLLVTFSAGSYRLRSDDLWLDVDDFEQTIDRGIELERVGNVDAASEALDTAIALYGGELLPVEMYEDWTVGRRQRLQERFVQALQHRAAIGRSAGDFELSIRLNQLVLEADPAVESAHRQLILDYLETGQRSRAAQQVEACRAALRRHLEAEPDRESLAVFARVTI